MKRKDFSQKTQRPMAQIMPILRLICISFQKSISGCGKNRALSETPPLITHHISLNLLKSSQGKVVNITTCSSSPGHYNYKTYI